MSKSAKPARYVVDRIGTPDPPAEEYFVLGLVHDVDCRTALAQLGNLYRRRGKDVHAEECFTALHETQEAHQVYIRAKNAREGVKIKKRRDRSDNPHA